MIRYAFNTRILLVAFFSSIAIMSLAFAGDDGDSFRGLPQNKQTTDTIPKKKRFERNAMDDESIQHNRVDMNVVENAMREVERSMQKLKTELGEDYQKHIKDNYKKAFDEINRRKIEGDYQRALTDARESMAYKKMNKQFNSQRQQMLSDINRQMELSNLNMERDMKLMQLALKVDVEKQMQNAKIQMQKTKLQVVEINRFKTDLEKDGLIESKGTYEIEIKGGDLYINGKKQKNKIYEKYKSKYPKYFEKGQHFKLNNDNRRIERDQIKGEGELI